MLSETYCVTVHIPVGVDKIHLFLAAVTADGIVKEVIGPGIGLIQEGNEVVFHGSFLVHIETELPVHCLELIACFIHASILIQFCPTVKSIAGDFLEFTLSVLGVQRESSPKSLMRIELTILTKISALEGQLATGL